MIEVRADFETRAAVNIKTRGAGAYFACPYFMPLLLRYRIGDGELKGWRVGDPIPADLWAILEDGCMIRAFNAAFERQCFDWLADHWGWPKPSIWQYVCTAAEAAAMSLPRSLDKVGEALGIVQKKDKGGMALINFFSKPRLARSGEPSGIYFNEPRDFPEKFDEFDAYCAQDVRAEEDVASRLFRLSPYEQRIYTLDQVINARGIRIDTASARAGVQLAAKAKRKFDARMKVLTGGAVAACGQVAAITQWVKDQGVTIPSMAKADIEDLLEFDDLPKHVREVLELRQEAGKTTVAKLTAFLLRTSPDDRIRNAFLYCAAGTGRWSSVGAQLHNLARPRKIFGDAHPDPDTLYATIRTEDPELVEYVYGPVLGRPLHLISDAIRGFIWAGTGHELVALDYSGIEGAVAAWLADERWKLDAMFELIQDDSLPDLYRRAAAGIFATTTDLLGKKDPRRQVGKVSELSMQYQGGVGAYRSMARNYSLKLDPLYDPVWSTANEERRDRVLKRYASCCTRKENTTLTMSRNAWIACDLIKVGWRAIHPAIQKNGWDATEHAAREAVYHPGQKFEAAKCQYLVKSGYLFCRLPSGRTLAYGAPRLKAQVWAKIKQEDGSWGEAEVVDRDWAERMEHYNKALIQGNTSDKVTVMGVDSVTRQWVRYGLYGGLLFENITQAVARDLLAHGLLIAEDAGYSVVGHVHDEIIAEVPRGFGDLAWLAKAICELPAWATGLPLTASGWRGKRYRKD